MYKLLVCDMDGTLTYDKEEADVYTPNKVGLPRLNQLFIEQFIEQGGKFAIATGRLKKDIEVLLGNKISKETYKAVQNGSYIFDPQDNIISTEVFSSELSNEVYNILDELGLPFTCSVSDCHYYHSSTSLEDMNNIFGKNVKKKLINKKEERPQNPANICVINTNTSKLENDIEVLSSKLDKDKLNYQITGPYTIDINPKSVNKGDSVLKLCKLLQIDPNDVAVVGDSYNDISMFKKFKNSYVMAHAKDDVKAFAKKEIEMVSDIK